MSCDPLADTWRVVPIWRIRTSRGSDGRPWAKLHEFERAQVRRQIEEETGEAWTEGEEALAHIGYWEADHGSR